MQCAGRAQLLNTRAELMRAEQKRVGAAAAAAERAAVCACKRKSTSHYDIRADVSRANASSMSSRGDSSSARDGMQCAGRALLLNTGAELMRAEQKRAAAAPAAAAGVTACACKQSSPPQHDSRADASRAEASSNGDSDSSARDGVQHVSRAELLSTRAEPMRADQKRRAE